MQRWEQNRTVHSGRCSQATCDCEGGVHLPLCHSTTGSPQWVTGVGPPVLRKSVPPCFLPLRTTHSDSMTWERDQCGWDSGRRDITSALLPLKPAPLLTLSPSRTASIYSCPVSSSLCTMSGTIDLHIRVLCGAVQGPLLSYQDERGGLWKTLLWRTVLRCLEFSSVITVLIVFLGSENQLQTVGKDLPPRPSDAAQIRFRFFTCVDAAGG